MAMIQQGRYDAASAEKMAESDYYRGASPAIGLNSAQGRTPSAAEQIALAAKELAELESRLTALAERLIGPMVQSASTVGFNDQQPAPCHVFGVLSDAATRMRQRISSMHGALTAIEQQVP